MSSRRRKAEIQKIRAAIEAREWAGRPYDSAYIGNSTGRPHDGDYNVTNMRMGPPEPCLFSRNSNVDFDFSRRSVFDQPEQKQPIMGIIAFILMLCIGSFLAVYVVAPELAAQKKVAAAAPVQTTSAPVVIRTASGKVESIRDTMQSSNTTNKGNIIHLIPESFITLSQSPGTFRLPAYLSFVLWDSDLRDAQRVEIQYMDKPLKHSMGYGRTSTHYDAIRVKVDGVTYLVPWMYEMLGNPLSWLFIGLLFWTLLGKPAHRWLMD